MASNPNATPAVPAGSALVRRGEMLEALARCASLLLAPAGAPDARRALLSAALGCLRDALGVARGLLVIRQSSALGVAGSPHVVAEVRKPDLPPHTGDQLFPDGVWAEPPPSIRARLLAGELWAGSDAELATLGAFCDRLHSDVSAVVVAPLQGSDSFWGSLVVADTATRAWEAEELSLLRASSRVIVSAIHRWEAEARLQASEANLRTVLAVLPIHCWMRDPGGRMVLQSDQSRHIWHPPRGSSVDDTSIPPTTRALWNERNRRAYAGEVVHDELTYTIDGEPRVFDDTILPVREGPNAGSIVGMMMDITRRKAIEVALAASEERFRLLAKQLPVLVLILDLDELRVAYSNKDSYLGYEREQLRDNSFMLSIVHPDDVAPALERWRQFVAGRPEAVLTDELRLRRADGAWEWMQRRGIWMRISATEEPSQVLMMHTIITSLKEAEEARRDDERRLLEAQKLESLGVLAGGIAHDFNNILTAILGHAELALLEVPLDSPVAGNLGHVVAGARHAAGITSQIFTYTGRSPRESYPLDLNALLREMVDFVQASLPKYVQIVWRPGADLPAVTADSAQLKHVVLGLVTNAAEALSPPEGVAVVCTFAARLAVSALRQMILGADLAPGLYVCLEVRDSGAGMEAATLARIFEPFFSTKFIGRGLGLAVVQGIVKAHHGAIEVRSRLGEGTTVRVWLPATAAALPRATPAPAPTPAFWGSALLIDDEERVRSVAGRMLERLGLKVFAVADGESGLAALAAGLPDLRFVLVDLTMPGMGGDAVVRVIQRRWADLPVVLMSGYGTAQIEQLMSGHAPAAILAKPFTLDALRAIVSRALEGQG
ncbi:MAG: response regulator [Chloroflexales bacterium]|nr:response regulator [Chloroflexales bacterium]